MNRPTMSANIRRQLYMGTHSGEKEENNIFQSIVERDGGFYWVNFYHYPMTKDVESYWVNNVTNSEKCKVVFGTVYF